MKHYIIAVALKPAAKDTEPKKYLVSVRKGVERRKHALGLALGLICGAERSPFMPFAWSRQKVKTERGKKELGKPWLERDEFEVRRLSDIKVKLMPQN